MKVIFLDVDGVLNSYSFASKMMEEEGVSIFREDILDKSCISCLKQIVQRTGAEIVLSSSWRKFTDARASLAFQLAENGLAIHSDTPVSATNGRRGNEISAWFSSHRDVPVEAYVILDDNSDMSFHSSHLVQTSLFDGGLRPEHVQQAVTLLTNDEKEE